jgi:hypothetical protein
MKYRVMQQLNYLYKGDDKQAAIDAFRKIAGGCEIVDETHDITREPMVLAFSPDDGEHVGSLYGVGKEEYEGNAKPH